MEQVKIDPVRRVLESSCIEKQDFLSLFVIASDRDKVAVTGLSKSLATDVAYCLESFML